jgi:hypothetical protein
MALLTFLVCFVYYITDRKKTRLALMLCSLAYLLVIFGIYFPHLTRDGYRYMQPGGLFSNFTISYLYDTPDKRSVLIDSIAWYGFLPLFAPLSLLPALGDITHYFIFGHAVTGAQGLFEHYRIALASLLALPTIYTISRWKKLNTIYIAAYLLLFALFFQYYLHLPISYLTKSWFWHTPPSVKNINELIAYLPNDASVVTQNNITPHISHREDIFTLWPEKKTFKKASPCGQPTCNWFHWGGDPSYLIVDTAPDWDIRHLLANRDDYIDGLHNLQKAGIISVDKQINDAVLYRINRHPSHPSSAFR